MVVRCPDVRSQQSASHRPEDGVLWRPSAVISRQSLAAVHQRLRKRCAPPLPATAAAAPPPPSLHAAISVRGVQLSFQARTGPVRVLDGVDIDVRRGSLHMLLGSNGCGKSTLLRVLGGLLQPSAGSLHVDAPAAFVFQNPDHQVVMPTVAADVAFGLGRYDLPEWAVQAAVAHSLGQVGLLDCAERPTSTLSGGQKQRVAIAGALAESPRVLLLDELTTFLDYEDQLNVLQCVRRIVDGSCGGRASGSDSEGSGSGSEGTGAGGAGERVTALWVTHRLQELEYADSVSYMEGGRIAFTGSPAQARAHMQRLGASV